MVPPLGALAWGFRAPEGVAGPICRRVEGGQDRIGHRRRIEAALEGLGEVIAPESVLKGSRAGLAVAGCLGAFRGRVCPLCPRYCPNQRRLSRPRPPQRYRSASAAVSLRVYRDTIRVVSHRP